MIESNVHRQITFFDEMDKPAVRLWGERHECNCVRPVLVVPFVKRSPSLAISRSRQRISQGNIELTLNRHVLQVMEK